MTLLAAIARCAPPQAQLLDALVAPVLNLSPMSETKRHLWHYLNSYLTRCPRCCLNCHLPLTRRLIAGIAVWYAVGNTIWCVTVVAIWYAAVIVNKSAVVIDIQYALGNADWFGLKLLFDRLRVKLSKLIKMHRLCCSLNAIQYTIRVSV